MPCTVKLVGPGSHQFTSNLNRILLMANIPTSFLRLCLPPSFCGTSPLPAVQDRGVLQVSGPRHGISGSPSPKDCPSSCCNGKLPYDNRNWTEACHPVVHKLASSLSMQLASGNPGHPSVCGIQTDSANTSPSRSRHPLNQPSNSHKSHAQTPTLPRTPPCHTQSPPPHSPVPNNPNRAPRP